MVKAAGIKRHTISEILFQYENYLVLSMLGIFTVFPFVYLLAVSFTPANELINVGKYILYFPRKLDFLAYNLIFQTDAIPQAYKVSVFITVVGTFLSMLVTAFTAYPLSRKRLPGKSIILFFITFTMLFNGGMIPTFLLVRNIGLIDTVWALIIPMLVNAFNTIIMKNYFMTIPDSMEESAKMDGANDFLILFAIIIPLSAPMLATITLFYAVSYWNDFFGAILYINNMRLYPLQVILRQILNSASSDMIFNVEAHKAATLSMRGASVIVTVLPIMLVYPFLQKYFTQGILLGSVKE